MIWPFVSRRAYEQVCQERDQWRTLVFENNDRWRCVVDRLLTPTEPKRWSEVTLNPTLQSAAFTPPEPKESLSTEVELMISQIAERDPGLRQQLTAHAYKLVENGTPMDEVCEHLLKPFEVEA
jgi:hypothetical protein